MEFLLLVEKETLSFFGSIEEWKDMNLKSCSTLSTEYDDETSEMEEDEELGSGKILLHHDDEIEIINTDETKQKRKRKKCVRFSTVSIREHPIIVGDNPSVSQGVPLTIDWDMIDSRECSSVEIYEKDLTRPRRHGPHLKHGPNKREKMLMGLGFTKEEQLVRVNAANAIRNHRRRSMMFFSYSNRCNNELKSISAKLRSFSFGRRSTKNSKKS